MSMKVFFTIETRNRPAFKDELYFQLQGNVIGRQILRVTLHKTCLSEDVICMEDYLIPCQTSPV